MGNQEQQDRILQQLIKEALQYPVESDKRRNVVYNLIALAEQLPGSQNENTVDAGLRAYYDNAREQIERGINKNIEKFPNYYGLDSDIGNNQPSVIRECFVRWYEKILKRKLISLSRVKKNRPLQSLDEPIGKDKSINKGEIVSDLKIFSPIEQAIFDENKRKQKQLFDFVNEGDEKILQNCFPGEYTKFNCWVIYQKRLFKNPPESWEEIANALNKAYGTNKTHGVISGHWHKKCKPLLKEIARRFGFEEE